MVKGLPRTQPESYAEDPAALRAQLEELRRDREDQLDELSQTSVGEDELAAPRLAGLRAVVAEIDAALRRLDDGSYGTCGKCDRRIPPERLEIMPHARYCVSCQQSGEQG